MPAQTELLELIEHIAQRGCNRSAADARKACELIRAVTRYGFNVLSRQDRELLAGNRETLIE